MKNVIWQSAVRGKGPQVKTLSATRLEKLMKKKGKNTPIAKMEWNPKIKEHGNGNGN